MRYVLNTKATLSFQDLPFTSAWLLRTRQRLQTKHYPVNRVDLWHNKPFCLRVSVEVENIQSFKLRLGRIQLGSNDVSQATPYAYIIKRANVLIAWMATHGRFYIPLGIAFSRA